MKQANIAVAIFAAVALSACGGGGSSSTETVQVAPPTGSSNNSDNTPTAEEVFASISAELEHTHTMNYARFDVLENDRMLVGYSPDKTAPELILVDYSDPENIIYNELGTGGFRRGVIEADFDHDSTNELYTYSHGYEYFNGDGELELASEGNNFYITETGEVKHIDDEYTHGACAGDFNGDTNIDIFDVNSSVDDPLVRYNDGNGNFDNVQEMPSAFLERIETFTACTVVDVDSDGFDDVVLGRNLNDIVNADESITSVPNDHVILFGGSDSLEFNENYSIVNGRSDFEFEDYPSTTGIYTTGDYMVAFVTDYNTTEVELYQREGDTYTFVEAVSLDISTLDIEVVGSTGIVTSTWTKDIDTYYTEPAIHVTVVDNALQIEERLRDK